MQIQFLLTGLDNFVIFKQRSFFVLLITIIQLSSAFVDLMKEDQEKAVQNKI